MKRRGLEAALRRELRSLHAPGEARAAERVRRRVLAAYTARPPAARPRRRVAAALAVAAVLLVVAAAGLTAPRQAIGDWLRDVVQRETAPRTPRAAGALPAGGRLLVAGPSGVSLVAGSMEAVRLGPYREAAWSPAGRFAAVTTGRTLLAVTPAGEVRWRVTPSDPPRSPRWAPDGFRLAYLAGHQLRVVVGDGTDDRLFRGHVRDVPPAFKPTAGRTLAWIDGDGHVRVADVDDAVLRWRSPTPVPARSSALSWSADGERILVAGRRGLALYDLGSRRVRSAPARGRVVAAGFPPRGSGRPALVERRGGRSTVRLLGRAEPMIATRGRYDGLTWAPDGRWLLTRWDGQWLLVRRDGRSVVTTPDQGEPQGWTP